MLSRLFKQFIRECSHVTTPEVILSLVATGAAFAFKAFLGGGRLGLEVCNHPPHLDNMYRRVHITDSICSEAS